MGNTESQHTGHSTINKTLTVDVLQNENAKNPVDVVLCFVDTKWGSEDRLSQALSTLAGNIHVTERHCLMKQHPTCSPGDVFTCSGGKINCKAILLVVVPEGDLSGHLLEVSTILQTSFQKAAELGARSIAIPLGIEPPFQVNAILPVLYMCYLKHDSRSSSLNLFRLVTIDPNIQFQILQTIKEMDDTVPHSNSEDDNEEEESVKRTENSTMEKDISSHHPVYQETTVSQEQEEHQCSSHEVNDLSDGCTTENRHISSDDIQTTEQMTNTALTNGEASEPCCVTELKSPFPVKQLHKQVERLSENDFLKSVCLKTSGQSRTRSVQFSEEVEEYRDSEQPPLVRSISSDSDEGGSRLDFQNFSIKRPVTRRPGKRPVQRGEPVVETKYDDETATKKADPVFFCVICQQEHRADQVTQKTLEKCRHVFCEKCIEEYFAQQKPVCPVCNLVYGEVTGDMPPGIMSYYTSEKGLPGHHGEGAIIIEYDIPDGIQTAEHPHPGKPFKGATRTAFLPNSDQGRKCHRLLQKAFDRRLTFTVGRSRTTGRDDCVTWNDIHHKTNVQGGPQRFGYPDPGYLDRLEQELKDRGLAED